MPLLWGKCLFAICFSVFGNTVAAGIAAFAMKVADGRDAADKEWRHFQPLFLKHLEAAFLRFFKQPLHPVGKFSFTRIAQHVLVGFSHDVADATVHIGCQVLLLLFVHK